MTRLLQIAGNKNALYLLLLAFVLMLTAVLSIDNQKLVYVVAVSAVVPLFVYLVFFRFFTLALFTIFLIPLSVKTALGGSVVSMPGELLTVILALVFLLFVSLRSGSQATKIWRHPVTILILLDLGWSLFTGLLGEMPLISVKRLFVRVVFVVVFYFLVIELFQRKKNLSRLWLIYGLGLVVPIIWTLIRHARHDFSKVVSFVMPLPFFNDHTLYAASIAFVLPVIVLLYLRPSWFGISRRWRTPLFALSVLLLTGLFFSFSRAAWLSAIAAALVGLMITVLRFKMVHFLIIVITSLGVLYYYSDTIYQQIETVDDVSRKEEVEEHFRSVMNVQSDASNLERINRWMCAVRMFRDRPLMGFGPGTYQFVYGSYQISPEMTRISTRHGEKGNAHSEYLMYLSETGIPGMLGFMLLILIVFNRSLKIFRTTHDKPLKWLIFAILLGFISFVVHGAFNSFLDTDKASVLFYAAIAAVVAIDTFYSSQDKPSPNNTDPGKGAGALSN